MEDEVTLESIRQALDKILPDESNGESFFSSFPTEERSESPVKQIFSKVQSDIQVIKKKVLTSLSSNQPIDHDEIKLLFEQTEKDLQKQQVEAEFLDFMNRPATIPFEEVFSDDAFVKQRTALENDGLPPIDMKLVNQLGKLEHTPGERALALQELKSIVDPQRQNNRQVLQKHYGVPAPVDDIKLGNWSQPRNPQMKLKPIEKEKDEKKKNASLKDINALKYKRTTKKEFSPASPVKPSPSQLPIKPRSVVLHQHPDKKIMQKVDKKQVENLALVKFDERTDDLSSLSLSDKKYNSFAATEESANSLLLENVNPHNTTTNNLKSLKLLHADHENLNVVGEKKTDVVVPVPSPSLDPSQQFKFTIENGITKEESPEFLLFKEQNILIYESIHHFLYKIEKLMKDYSVPIAIVDGQKLIDVSLFFALQSVKPTIKDLLVPIVNHDDVEAIIRIPGRRYLAYDGKKQAAIKLQSTWRRFKMRNAYLEYRRRKWAAGLIALTWIMKCKITSIRRVMKENRAKSLEDFRNKAKVFSDNWGKLKSSKRLIIHMPSLGFPSSVREKSSCIPVLENQQIGRIFDVLDPDVEVLYISPVVINEQLKQYYFKLIHVMCEVSDQDYSIVKEKLRILTPDSVGKFPEHNLCASTMIKYSTNTLRRLKQLVKGKQAYIVPSLVNADDLYVAEKLNLPLLGSEPDLVSLFSLKSGVRRIFSSAEVMCPPGEYDIYSIHQLHEALARLVVENLDIKRWLFKIDNQFNGSGTAYCDVTPHLKCYEYAIREQEKYGEKWSKKWANENVYNEVLKEIPSILEQYIVTVDASMYSNGEIFIGAFLKQGGIIEATPPSGSVTGISSHLVIEPDGNVKILATSDQIHSTSPYKCFGYTLPQSSIGSETLLTSTSAIAEACRQRGIIGYLSIDFITFICPNSEEQKLWAVGLFIGYSSALAMFQMANALTNGVLDTNENTFIVTSHNNISNNVFYKSRRRKALPSHQLIVEKKPRFCVYSTRLLHSNMNNVQYNVFFQLCKARGIGFDEKMKLGTSFAIFDQTRRDSMGMITFGESLHEAVSLFALNLQLIHTDISTVQMQGVQNFSGAMNDLKMILLSLEENKNIDQENYPTASPTFKKYQDSCHEVLRDVITPTQSFRPSSTTSHVSIKTSQNNTMMSTENVFDHRLPSSPVSDVSIFPK